MIAALDRAHHRPHSTASVSGTPARAIWLSAGEGQNLDIVDPARHREEARCAKAVSRWTRPTSRLQARGERPPGSHVVEISTLHFFLTEHLSAAWVRRTRRQRSMLIRRLPGHPARPYQRVRCAWRSCFRWFQAPMMCGLLPRMISATCCDVCCAFRRSTLRELRRRREVRMDLAAAADNARRMARALRSTSSRCGKGRRETRGAAGNLGWKGLKCGGDDELR